MFFFYPIHSPSMSYFWDKRSRFWVGIYIHIYRYIYIYNILFGCIYIYCTWHVSFDFSCLSVGWLVSSTFFSARISWSKTFLILKPTWPSWSVKPWNGSNDTLKKGRKLQGQIKRGEKRADLLEEVVNGNICFFVCRLGNVLLFFEIWLFRATLLENTCIILY